MRCRRGCRSEVSKDAKIRNRYNQVPHLTQDTNGKVTNSKLDTILRIGIIRALNESEASYWKGNQLLHLNNKSFQYRVRFRGKVNRFGKCNLPVSLDFIRTAEV